MSNPCSPSQSLHTVPRPPLSSLGPLPARAFPPNPGAILLSLPSLIPLLGPGHPTPTPSRTQIQTLRKEPLAAKQRVSIFPGSGVLGEQFRAGMYLLPLTSTEGDILSMSVGCNAST